MNICMKKICFHFFWVCLVDWLDDMESGRFIFLRNFQITFQGDYAILFYIFPALFRYNWYTKTAQIVYNLGSFNICVHMLTNVYYYHPGNKYISLFKTFLVSLFLGEGVFVIRAQHELYPLYRILSTQCIINQNRYVVQLISSTYSSCETNFTPIKQLPNPLLFFPGNHHFIVYFYTFDYFDASYKNNHANLSCCD